MIDLLVRPSTAPASSAFSRPKYAIASSLQMNSGGIAIDMRPETLPQAAMQQQQQTQPLLRTGPDLQQYLSFSQRMQRLQSTQHRRRRRPDPQYANEAAKVVNRSKSAATQGLLLAAVGAPAKPLLLRASRRDELVEPASSTRAVTRPASALAASIDSRTASKSVVLPSQRSHGFGVATENKRYYLQ